VRLRREQREQVLREQQRQRMASIQARMTALDSSLKVNIAELETTASNPARHRAL
jgi:type IV secretion system protein VirB10